MTNINRFPTSKILSLFAGIAMIIALLACNTTKPKRTSVHQLAWLQGTWERTDVKDGETAYEKWAKSEDNSLFGKGVSLKGQDTVFVEQMWIVKKEEKLYFKADVPQNPKPIFFEIIDIRPFGFTCANPSHDFPKQINYTLDKNLLLVTISGDGKSSVFHFKKKVKMKG